MIPSFADLYHSAPRSLSDPEFLERTTIVEEALYLSRVLPTSRNSQNGHLHRRFAAAIVALIDCDEADVPTRDLDQISRVQNLPQSSLLWLDIMLSEDLLQCESKRAKGTIWPTDKLKAIGKRLTNPEIISS